MSLNNITLSDIIITEWYSADALIPSANPAALRPASQPAPRSAPTQPTTPPVTAKPEPVIPSEPSVQPTPQPVTTPAAEKGIILPEAAATATPPATATPKTSPAATPTQPSATNPTEPESYKFLGNHRRKVTIIVDSPGSAFLPDDQLGFLSKILEACRMNIGDVAIVNHHTQPVTINTLRGQLQPVNIILFGVDPTAIRLPINFPAFKLQPYDQCTYLYAPPLQQLVANTADAKLLKSKLWVCLKTLFDV